MVGDSFERCSSYLFGVLKRCKDCNLVLNWERCHLKVKKGIVLGNRISKKRIAVDRAKVEVIERLPPPIAVKRYEKFFRACKLLLEVHQGFFKDCTSFEQVA